LPLSQLWEMEITDEGAIDWKMQIQTDEEINIKKGQVNILLCSQYCSWVSIYRKWKFPPLFKEEWEVVEPSLRSNYIGLQQPKGDKLPALLFELESPLLTQIVLQNTGQYQEARVITAHMTDINLKLDRGIHVLSCGRISIFDKDQQLHAYLSQKKEQISLSQGPLRLILDDGTARIYYKDVELTKGEGINTSFKAGGQLYTSTQALWQIDKISNQKITARGRWPDLPLSQLWEMEITDEGTIGWKVGIIIDKEVKIKRWKSSLMLSGE